MGKTIFQGRAFVSMLMALGIVIVTVSGVALYVAPRGWAAQAQDWRFLFLGKRDWINLHIVFGLLFPLAAGVHVWLNRKPLAGYLRSRLRGQIVLDWLCRLRLELLAALIVCLFLGAAVLRSFPPATTLLEWRAVIAEFRLQDGMAGPGQGRGRPPQQP
ncbi:MAG: DUF4405 domain-containing protein [Alphaproteobacteria bacterium]|nr:DUF4405 domain-containing protein [Alphaproteobacteria bacterium]